MSILWWCWCSTRTGGNYPTVLASGHPVWGDLAVLLYLTGAGILPKRVNVACAFSCFILSAYTFWLLIVAGILPNR
jgi:hypothetical protein